MSRPVDVELTRLALASSTLSHGLGILGDRWTVQVMLGTFTGLKRFDQWQQVLGIPRHTLSERLRNLTALGLLEPRPYQQRPLRHSYHPSAKALALYPQVLMMWAWERRWGQGGANLPAVLLHRRCGHRLMPVLACRACTEDADITRMQLRLEPVPALLQTKARPTRAPRIPAAGQPSLGLRVDRWSLLIVTAVVLGCHHFDELSQVLGIGPSVLARRLEGMVEFGLLRCESDRSDGRRRIYRLTAASRDLLGYIVCLSHWASRHHLHQPSSIIPTHSCGHEFAPQVVCSHCREEVQARDVLPEGKPTHSPRAAAAEVATA
ncbi:MAG: winged helix-turn-helix transcriptional regulator [Betaproteobacteria bacterium]